MRLTTKHALVGFGLLFIVGMLVSVLVGSAFPAPAPKVVVSTEPAAMFNVTGRYIPRMPAPEDLKAMSERPWATQLYLGNLK